MTAVDTATPLRLDRYLALLAILMGLVFGLLVVGERQRPAPGVPAIEGRLPPPADASPAATTTRADLAQRLEATEEALRRAETEIERLRQENRALTERLENEGAALDEITNRLAVVEAEHERLSQEVRALTEARDRLEAQLAEAIDRPSPPPALASGTVPGRPGPARDAAATVAAQPGELPAGLEASTGEQQAEPARSPEAAGEVGGHRAGARAGVGAGAGAGASAGDADGAAAADRTGAGAGKPAARSTEPAMPRRLLTFDGHGGSVADGIAAYRDNDFATAERIWGPLAASGDPRAQFHFGALLYEGRTSEPDLVMAHVWLSRAVDGGHLPAIELRREVRSAMTEAQYREALAIRTNS